MKIRFLKSTLFKHTAVYTITDGISKGLSFLTLPFISYYLIPEELGISANFDVLQNILMLLAGQAIVNAMPYFFYGKTHEERSLIVSNLLGLIVASNVIFSVLIFFFSGMIEDYLHIGLLLQLLTTVSVVAHLLSSLNLVIYRLEEKPYAFGLLQILQTIIYLVLLVLFVVVLKWNAIGKIYSVVIAFSIMALVHLVLLMKRKYIVIKYSKEDCTKLLKFGLPLLPHSLSFWFKSGLDKVIITAYCGLAVNGIYSMALSFGALYTIFNTAFSNSYIPYLQKRINAFTEDNIVSEKKAIVRLSYLMMVGFAVLSIFAVFVCWLAIKYFLSADYADSFQFIPYIMIGLTFNSIYGLVIQFPYTIKKTLGMGIITFSGSIIQLLLTYVLVLYLDVEGIKISYVVGSFIIMAGVWWYSNKVYPMPWFDFIKRNK